MLEWQENTALIDSVASGINILKDKKLNQIS